MSGLEFEKYIRFLLIDHGYRDVRLTEKNDLGIDIIAKKDADTWGIQVKRYGKPVRLEAVRQVVTALRYYNCNKAMVVTNSTYTRQAKEIANSIDCLLIDREQLIELILDTKEVS